METEFGGLLLEVGDAAGLIGRGLFEGFRFVVSHAAGDDRVEADKWTGQVSTVHPRHLLLVIHQPAQRPSSQRPSAPSANSAISR